MLNIDATDKIEGIASVADKVEFTCSVVDGTTVKSSEGLLSNSQTQIYLAVAATRILSLTLVNKHTSAVTVNVQKDPTDAGTLYRIIPKDLSLGIGYLLVSDGQRCTVLDASGNLLTSFANLISDATYGAGWNGVTTIAPSKNAVYDEMETRTKASAVITDHRLVRGDGGVRGIQESTIIVDDSGRMTNPSQPAFSAHITVQEDNVTGDGTTWLSTTGVNNWTEIFDQGNVFDGDGLFTAPISGKYYLTCGVVFAGVLATHTRLIIAIYTSNRNYTLLEIHAGNVKSNLLRIPFTALADMDANDTAHIYVMCSGDTKVLDITTETMLQGVLIC